MQSVLKFLSICMAGFSEAYYKEGTKFSKTTSSMWTSGKYYWNPELRARRIVNISQNAEIDFCKVCKNNAISILTENNNQNCTEFLVTG